MALQVGTVVDAQAPQASGPPFMADATAASGAVGPLEVSWANGEEDVRAAQRLRHEVFATEMGARLSVPAGTPSGLDVDRFDAFCDHLLVRQARNDGEPGLLLGTYRMLTPSASRRAGGGYMASEFDLSAIKGLRGQAVELGRACVHPAWRSGAVIMALWRALGSYMVAHRLDTMIGCASIGLNDGGVLASDIWHRLKSTHMVPTHWQIRPHHAFPIRAHGGLNAHGGEGLFVADTPALLKGYMRCGARLMGPPALDAAFNTADLPIMLRMDELSPRYRRHFLGSA